MWDSQCGWHALLRVLRRRRGSPSGFKEPPMSTTRILVLMDFEIYDGKSDEFQAIAK